MLELNSCILLSDKDYRLEKLLGKGKGGYSYLASCGRKFFVLKQIHHEPCSYYQFGNKIMAELNDYERLKNAGIRIPLMIAHDVQNERILKEYIDAGKLGKASGEGFYKYDK